MLIRRLSLAAHRAAASREGSTAGPPPVDGRSAWRSRGALAAILCLLVLAQLALTATYALRFNVWVERYDPTTFAWRSRQQVRAVLDDALGDARECWLITQGAERILDYPVHPELLESEVAERFATLSTSSLHGDTTLRLLRRLDAP